MITHYVCRERGCPNYGVLVPYTTVYLSGSSKCTHCGVEMKARRAADRKVSRKVVARRVVGSSAVYQKRSAKRVAKRSYKKGP
jgi:hypothetical protein